MGDHLKGSNMFPHNVGLVDEGEPFVNNGSDNATTPSSLGNLSTTKPPNTTLVPEHIPACDWILYEEIGESRQVKIHETLLEELSSGSFFPNFRCSCPDGKPNLVKKIQKVNSVFQSASVGSGNSDSERDLPAFSAASTQNSSREAAKNQQPDIFCFLRDGKCQMHKKVPRKCVN